MTRDQLRLRFLSALKMSGAKFDAEYIILPCECGESKCHGWTLQDRDEVAAVNEAQMISTEPPTTPSDGEPDGAERLTKRDADALDAARYRWLRDLPAGSPHECVGNMPGDWWDDEIDARMRMDDCP